MKTASFLDLSHNILAIYEATRTDPSYTNESEDQLYKNLIPNFTCLNDNRNVNFSTNTTVHYIINSSLYKSETCERIKAALDYTHLLFHHYQEKLMNFTLSEYEKTLMAKISNENVDKRLCKETQEKIQKFYNHTQYFFIELRTGINKRITAIFKKHFCKDCCAHVDRLHKNNAIISLQGEVGDDLPLNALINASYESKEGDNDLKAFVKILAAKKTDIRMLHSALNGIIDHAKKFHQTEANRQLHRVANLATLESHLYNLDKSIFRTIDNEHLLFRKSLKEDVVLSSDFYDEKTGKISKYMLTLGKQIGKKEQSEFDKNIFFEIKTIFKDQEEQKQLANSSVCWVTINRTLAGIKWAQLRSCNVIQPATFHFIDNQGRFALVDKLQSLPQGSLKSNKEFYACIARWVGWLCTNSITLDHLRAENIMLAKHPTDSHRNVLTSVKITKPLDKFSYSDLEQFVYDISKGKQDIFNYIMNESGLAQTDDAQFFKALTLESFNPEMDPARAALGKTFKDKSTLVKAIKMQQDIVKMQNECSKILKLNNISIPTSELQKHILEMHQQMGCISFLWPTFQNDILARFKLN